MSLFSQTFYGQSFFGILKWISSECIGERGLDLFPREWGKVAGNYKHKNEPSILIQGCVFLDWLRNC
jgi:hypothetical protein